MKNLSECPDCGGALNALRGADGHAVDVVIATDQFGGLLPGAPLVERKRLDAVYACSACDYVHGAR